MCTKVDWKEIQCKTWILTIIPHQRAFYYFQFCWDVFEQDQRNENLSLHIHHIFILTTYIHVFVCVCVRRTVFVHLVCLFQKHLPFLCPYICSWAHFHPHLLKTFSTNTVLEPTHNLELLQRQLWASVLPRSWPNTLYLFWLCCTATSTSLFSLSVYIKREREIDMLKI